ncbi:MAG: N-6 DNA methylase [Polyangiales bacterium]
MTKKRDVLVRLTRDELLAAADRLGVDLPERRAKDPIVETLVGSRKAPVAEILADLKRDRLKELCRELGLDDSGKEKAEIVARLTGESKTLEENQLGLGFGADHSKAAEPASAARPSEPAPAEATAEAKPRRGRPAKAEKAASKGGELGGLETKLWQAADKLRNNMDAAEYKHVVLGLLFLKYISDAFLEKHAALEADAENGADPEDADEYRADGVFWVPKEARWPGILAQAKQPTIGKVIDDAMVAVERENPSLKGALPKVFARPDLDKQRLGELVDLFSNVGLGDKENRSKDLLGRVYEYFLGEFASAEGKNGGQFYTPRSVVRLLVEMLAPYKGRVYDPCCGSGGMFVQSELFLEAHGGKLGDISVYGQESNPTTWRLCRMNLAIRGIEANLGAEPADTFHADQHKDLKADYILANPPFNVKDWGQERLTDDVRWKYGVPPAGNANFGWMQHIVHHLAPTGTAGFVLANGSMSSQQSGEGEIRKALVEADLVDCMVALPSQLFYTTQIPACLWFLARDRKGGKLRDRRGKVLFIDARKLGTMVTRVHRELADEDVARIVGTYHAWRGDADAVTAGAKYEDVPGFCKSATLAEVAAHQYVLTPGRYVGAEDGEDDEVPFEERMKGLVARLEGQFAEGRTLETTILAGLSRLGGVQWR